MRSVQAAKSLEQMYLMGLFVMTETSALSILRVRIAEYQFLRPEPGARAHRLILISNLDKALAFKFTPAGAI